MQIEAIFLVPSSTLVLGGMYDPRHFRRQKKNYCSRREHLKFRATVGPDFFFFSFFLFRRSHQTCQWELRWKLSITASLCIPQIVNEMQERRVISLVVDVVEEGQTDKEQKCQRWRAIWRVEQRRGRVAVVSCQDQWAVGIISRLS